MDGVGLVAAGERRVAEVAAGVMAAGGNAFDAAVAAGFTAAVVEPALTSLGGCGFCLARTAGGEELVVDFFVDMPGLGRPAAGEPHLETVVVVFPGVEQQFVVGLGSAAVPGGVAGLLHLHGRFGRLPLADVIEPAARLADGHEVDPFQAYAATLLTPILTATPAAASLFAPGGRPIAAGDRFANPELASFLRALPGSAASLHGGPIGERLAGDAAVAGGLVTTTDLAGYRVADRAPLATPFRGCRVLTNPPPSTGGELVGVTLSLLDERLPVGAEWGSPAHAVALVEAMVATDEHRAAQRASSRGTTHVSVADGDGNVASMTTSNGEGCGYLIPGTGTMLNNMLGEDDLHPDGFHVDPPGQRVRSMMAPSVVVDAGGRAVLVLGSGGSKRIRTAIVQVIVASVALGMDADAAVGAPRLHWDGTAVQLEPGWPSETVAALAERWSINQWSEANMYFGGVHAVVPGRTAAGDTRRGGAAASAQPPSGGPMVAASGPKSST